jgi:hypothetical protein
MSETSPEYDELCIPLTECQRLDLKAKLKRSSTRDESNSTIVMLHAKAIARRARSIPT